MLILLEIRYLKSVQCFDFSLAVLDIWYFSLTPLSTRHMIWFCLCIFLSYLSIPSNNQNVSVTVVQVQHGFVGMSFTSLTVLSHDAVSIRCWSLVWLQSTPYTSLVCSFNTITGKPSFTRFQTCTVPSPLTVSTTFSLFSAQVTSNRPFDHS